IPKHIVPNQYTTLFFTGRGPFYSFLFKINATTSPTCDCGLEDETSIHLLTNCPLFRHLITKHFNHIPLITEYTNNKHNYSSFVSLCKEILHKLNITHNQ